MKRYISTQSLTAALLVIAASTTSVLPSFKSWVSHTYHKAAKKVKHAVDNPKNTIRYEYDTATELTPIMGIGSEVVAAKHVTIDNLSGQAIEINLLKKNNDTILSINQEVSVPKNVSYTTGVIDSDHPTKNPLKELAKITIHYVHDNTTKTYDLTKTDKNKRGSISNINVHALKNKAPIITLHH